MANLEVSGMWCKSNANKIARIFEPYRLTQQIDHPLFNLICLVLDKKSSNWSIQARRKTTHPYKIVAEGDRLDQVPPLEEAIKLREEFLLKEF